MKPIIICGPCVIESMECLEEVAQEIVRLNNKFNLDIIFKSSKVILPSFLYAI